MISVIDTNYIIRREVPLETITRGYITSGVASELRTREASEYLESHGFSITVRDPKGHYVKQMEEACKKMNFGLSAVDISVAALTAEISDELGYEWIDPGNASAQERVVCLTRDNGILSLLSKLGLHDNPLFQDKTYKMRCWACFELYDDPIVFCKKCGYNKITRVSVITTEDGEVRPMLSRHYVNKETEIRDGWNRIIYTEDQREYKGYKKAMHKSGK